MPLDPNNPKAQRVQIVVALIAAAAVILAATVTSGFGLLSSGPATGSVTANGGNSQSDASCVSGGVVVQGTVNCATVTKEPSGQLRATIVPTDPGVFNVAFANDIGLPKANTGWQELHDQGGVDVYQALFNVTLANRSDKPVTVRDIHIEVVGAAAAPNGSRAFVFTQGDGPVSQFASRITTTADSTRSPLYKSEAGGPPGWEKEPPDPPFFKRNYIALRPGEIYEATVSVTADLSEARMVRFRFVISGSTPERNFTLRDSAVSRVSSLVDRDSSTNPQYQHYYVDGFLAHAAANNYLCPGMRASGWYGASAADFKLGGCPGSGTGG
jgi:hypothetical protein